MKKKFYLYGLVLMVVNFFIVVFCISIHGAFQFPHKWDLALDMSAIVVAMLLIYWLLYRVLNRYHDIITMKDCKILGAIWMAFPIIIVLLLHETDWFLSLWSALTHEQKPNFSIFIMIAAVTPGAAIMNGPDSMKQLFEWKKRERKD